MKQFNNKGSSGDCGKGKFSGTDSALGGVMAVCHPRRTQAWHHEFRFQETLEIWICIMASNPYINLKQH